MKDKHGLAHHKYYYHVTAKIRKKGFKWGSLTIEQKREMILTYEQNKRPYKKHETGSHI